MALSDSALSTLQSTLTNPGGNFSVPVHNKTFPTESFDSGEAEMFSSQLASIITGTSSDVLGTLFDKRSDTLGRVASYAKHELDGKVFGGINAGDNEIGFSVLRPGQIRADPSNGNPVNDWYFDPSTTDYEDWIGDGSGNDFDVGEDQVVAVFGFTDMANHTEVSGINVQHFGRNMDMLPQDLNDARLRDNTTEQAVVELPTLVASDNDSVHVRLDHSQLVESEPRLLGITFGIGAYLNSESYS